MCCFKKVQKYGWKAIQTLIIIRLEASNSYKLYTKGQTAEIESNKHN